MEKEQQSKRSLYLAAGIIGTLTIGCGGLAVQGISHVASSINSELKTAYQKVNGSYVPSTYVQVPESKTPSNLEEVLQHGDWQFSNGMVFTLEQTDEGINNQYSKYLSEKIQGEDDNGGDHGK